MSAAAARTGSGVADRVRRSGLALVMVGALSVSVRGQVQAVEPLLGGMSVVLALTNDLAALLALNELMSTQRRAVRRWAWAVLVLAGGTAAGLNTWHALEASELPPLWAVVVGIGPVLLAVVLSHLVALVLDEAPEQREAVEGSVAAAGRVAATAPPPRTVDRSAPAPVRAQGDESSRATQASTAALSGPVHHGLAVVEAPREPCTPARPGGSGPRPRDVAGTDPRVERLTAQLHAGVELTGASAAEQLGCSPRTGRRLLRQAEEYLASTRTSARPAAERGRDERRTATGR